MVLRRLIYIIFLIGSMCVYTVNAEMDVEHREEVSRQDFEFDENEEENDDLEMFSSQKMVYDDLPNFMPSFQMTTKYPISQKEKVTEHQHERHNNQNKKSHSDTPMLDSRRSMRLTRQLNAGKPLPKQDEIEPSPNEEDNTNENINLQENQNVVGSNGAFYNAGNFSNQLSMNPFQMNTSLNGFNQSAFGTFPDPLQTGSFNNSFSSMSPGFSQYNDPNLLQAGSFNNNLSSMPVSGVPQYNDPNMLGIPQNINSGFTGGGRDPYYGGPQTMQNEGQYSNADFDQQSFSRNRGHASSIRNLPDKEVVKNTISSLVEMGAIKNEFLKNISLTMGKCVLCGRITVISPIGIEEGICSSCVPRAVNILKRNYRSYDDVGYTMLHYGSGQGDSETDSQWFQGSPGAGSQGFQGGPRVNSHEFQGSPGAGSQGFQGGPRANSQGFQSDYGRGYGQGSRTEGADYADLASRGMNAVSSTLSGRGGESLGSAITGIAGSLLQNAISEDRKESSVQNVAIPGQGMAQYVLDANGKLTSLAALNDPRAPYGYVRNALGQMVPAASLAEAMQQNLTTSQSKLSKGLQTANSIANTAGTFLQQSGLGNAITFAAANKIQNAMMQNNMMNSAMGMGNMTNGMGVNSSGMMNNVGASNMMNGAANLSGALTSVNRRQIEAQLNDVTSEILLKTNTLKTLQNKLTAAQTSLQNAQSKLAGAKNAMTRGIYQSSVNSATKKLAIAQANFDNLQVSLDGLKQQQQSLQAQLSGGGNNSSVAQTSAPATPPSNISAATVGQGA
ncbi:MAG: hypothetical protein E7015_00005 [Alphaproteobacteria bacterium]|nr:hypothetical protein [Alphaproteobacteria bacterium]